MDEPSVLAMLEAKGAIKLYSFVHEVGDENEDNPTPGYAHTHVFADGVVEETPQPDRPPHL